MGDGYEGKAAMKNVEPKALRIGDVCWEEAPFTGALFLIVSIPKSIRNDRSVFEFDVLPLYGFVGDKKEAVQRWIVSKTDCMFRLN